MTTRRSRHRNSGLRKRCSCARKVWPKCPHSWQFNFKPHGGPHYRISLDRELGRHIDSKAASTEEADRIRTAIRNGTFRPMYHLGRHTSPSAGPISIEQLGQTYIAEYVGEKTEGLSDDERLRWHLVMRTEIQRVNGSERFRRLRSRGTTLTRSEKRM
jgi:hypothetical protein